jgi:hypothetical protein
MNPDFGFSNYSQRRKISMNIYKYVLIEAAKQRHEMRYQRLLSEVRLAIRDEHERNNNIHLNAIGEPRRVQ